MIPIGPLVGIAVWAALRNREGGGTARGPAPDGPAATLAQRPVPSWFWAHCGYAVVAAIALTQLGAWAAPPFVVLYAPWLLALGAARLGLVRPARLLGDLALFAFRKDPAGAPGFAGALALARRRVHDERWAARLVAGLDRLPVPVRGAALAARGLVAASRGHVEEARDLLGSVEHLDPRITPRPVRRIARDWLAADAAARGRWDEVERLARIAGPRSRAVRLLGLVARRLRGGGDAPG
ncbi:MAG TPA: hypothetical protein VLT47_13605, partial [Anaeromyxobacteraceae bacterium]|nr:hypothetical protein [Anaeromyxobacteraceae bacterium]